ncbi:MAG TPA: DUF4835 domain-containing protein [Cytophagales bacterium]|jgi:hypothetical protein|nr:DUF4835 domain-containing protein [Cytophagales bacterium]
MKKIALLLAYIPLFFSLQAQELKVNVIVDSEQIKETGTGSYTDKTFFRDMQVQISTFLNTTKWTKIQFKPEERLSCNLYITIREVPSQNQFKGTAQFQSSRPVYASSYESILMDFVDTYFEFEYALGQQMIYNDNQFTSNLTSLLAFYAYTALALDFDSYGYLGGNPYLEKALEIVNTAQQQSYKGWKAFDGQNVRYWLNENHNNQQLIQLREAVYEYHRLGLDNFSFNADTARTHILASIGKIKKAFELRPTSVFIKSFLNGKAEELVKIFQQASPEQKQQAYDLLRMIDATNNEKYLKIISG